MKKRKPPILLATVLLILVGFIVVWNMPKEEPKQIAPTPGESAPRADVSADQVSKEAQNALNSKPAPANSQPGEAPPAGNGKSIVVPSTAGLKPKPNDSAPAGQWYATESHKPGK